MRNISISIVVVVAIVGFLLWYSFRQSGPVPEPETIPNTVFEPRQPTDQADFELPKEEPQPESTPEWPNFNLPSLDESDTVLINEWNELTEQPIKGRIKGIKHLLRRLVTATDLISRNKNPFKQIYAFRPAGEFQVEQRGDLTFLAVENYERFDALVDALDKIDTQRVVKLYRHIDPLLNEAFAELGDPSRTWKSTLIDSIDQLLLIEVPDTPPELVGQKGIYIYKDQELEASSPLQKLLVRMGKDNAQKCQAKARELRSLLE